MGATIAKNEIYEPKKLDAIYQTLLSLQQSGREQPYEIRVDEFPVVGKTTDPARFMDYTEHITPETRYISVLLFKANGQSDKYFFHMQQASFQKAEELKGLDQQRSAQVNEKELAERIRKDLHYEALIAENEALREEIKENAEDYLKLHEQLQETRSNRDMTLSGAVSILLDGAKGSKTMKETFPFMGQFSGTEEKPDPENKASFKRKGDKEQDNVEDAHEIEEDENGMQTYRITEKQRRYILFIEDIRRRIGDIELANVMHLLDLVASNPAAIPYAIRHVTNFLKMKDEHTNQAH